MHPHRTWRGRRLDRDSTRQLILEYSPLSYDCDRWNPLFENSPDAQIAFMFTDGKLNRYKLSIPAKEMIEQIETDHENYTLWFPAGINPDQRPLIEAVFTGDAEPGEFRLIERDDVWYLHLSVHFEPADTDCSEADAIPVGVDIGEATLATVCRRDDCGSPTAPTSWNDEAKTVRELREQYFTATRRLQKRGSEVLAETCEDEIWRQIDDIIHAVSREVVDHGASVDGGVIVLENLTHIRESVDYGTYMNRRLHG